SFFLGQRVLTVRYVRRMAATRMDGTALAAKLRARVADEARELGEVGLMTVLVGDDPASEIYIRRKHEAAAAAGFRTIDRREPATLGEAARPGLIAEANADDAVDALLVQLPLPEHIDEEHVARAVDPVKDVDGLHPLNAGELALGRPRLVPATAVGILELLR